MGKNYQKFSCQRNLHCDGSVEIAIMTAVNESFRAYICVYFFVVENYKSSQKFPMGIIFLSHCVQISIGLLIDSM